MNEFHFPVFIGYLYFLFCGFFFHVLIHWGVSKTFLTINTANQFHMQLLVANFEKGISLKIQTKYNFEVKSESNMVWIYSFRWLSYTQGGFLLKEVLILMRSLLEVPPDEEWLGREHNFTNEKFILEINLHKCSPNIFIHLFKNYEFRIHWAPGTVPDAGAMQLAREAREGACHHGAHIPVWGDC